jgi:hypothetical protein
MEQCTRIPDVRSPTFTVQPTVLIQYTYYTTPYHNHEDKNTYNKLTTTSTITYHTKR